MQGAVWTLALGLACALAVLGGWWGADAGLAWAVCAVCAAIAVRAHWQSHRLDVWLRGRAVGPAPRLQGVWFESVQRIERVLRLRDKQLAQQEQRLRHFLQAIQASPIGVVLLDMQGRIEWCNETASLHVGLDAQRDRLQHIAHLLRDPRFSRYFAQEQHEQDLLIDGQSPSAAARTMVSLHVHAFGEGRRLLLTRDVTQLTQADAMRRDFVANVSHEIRTPLTVLGGFVETLQTLALSPEQQQHYLNLMAIQSQRMQALVADLLTLSQLEGRPHPGAQERTDLRELMAHIQADAQALSALTTGHASGQGAAGHRLRFEPTPDWVLWGARAELHSAMMNLVSNAIRYTPAGGDIHVGWSQEAGQLVFAVTDTGPGIASEHLPRLSERFYRVDRSRSRDTGGTGLGLAITKHVAQRHGGQLRIQSEVGRGSVFALVLPPSRRTDRAGG